MPLGTAMLLYTGVGAVSVVVPLVLIGLALLIIMRFKKRGEGAFTHTHTACCSTYNVSLIFISDLCRKYDHVSCARMGRQRESSIRVLIFAFVF